ncbi:MAG: NADH-quinone oxidoreductase subunit H [Methanobacteriaceae archaeon]|jgi:energy-converting hydrogenase B subunit O|nr:NADH-quinone oxidoreductase subunit H [Methanobacteriaceae archaeon]
MLNILITVALTVLVCFIISTLLPGIERKYIHARIQQRIGPMVLSPGVMAPIKFCFKENIKPRASVPGLYKSLPIICFIVVLCILAALVPSSYIFPAFASIITIVGLLKIEEVCYVFMGALSKSIMSLAMPFPDVIKGGAHLDVERSYMEDLSAKRALRLISYGSFPMYLAIFAPVAASGSIFLGDIVAYQHIHGPFLFTLSGIIAAVVFFVGYMILLNDYPFAILKTKADVIEGPYMEYASKYRAFVFITRGFLMFTLGVLFSVLFIGVPPNIFSVGIIVNIVVALIFVILMGIFSAFSPIFTNRQFFPAVIGVSVLGVLAIALGLL